MSTRIEKVSYHGWQSCWLIENRHIRLITVGDVGPRILHLSLAARSNLLYEEAENLGKRGGDEFRMYGGHRFWIAPENERTILPDNHPAEAQQLNSGVRFTTIVHNLRKSIDIRMCSDQPQVELTHTVQNMGEGATELAPWALTVFRPGGEAVLPLPEPAPWGPEHLQPEASLALWSYTDLGASCWSISPEFIRLHQPSVASCGFGMQKIGLRNLRGWAAYRLGNIVFHKSVRWSNGEYPDLGSNLEIFANSEFLELETLGPLTTLAPGQSCTLEEQWQLSPAAEHDDWFRNIRDRHV